MPEDAQRPAVALIPAPQTTARIFTQEALAVLHERYRVIDLEHDDRPGALDEVLPEVFAVIGQPDLGRDRLNRAPKLHAIINVEGNFFPNIDYQACYDQGIYVLGCGPAYAQAVAEHSLGLAIDIARGISREDRAFRDGTEHYVATGNEESVLLHGSRIGLLGYGNLGRALHRLLQPFDADIRGVRPLVARRGPPSGRAAARRAGRDHPGQPVPLRPGHRDRPERAAPRGP